MKRKLQKYTLSVIIAAHKPWFAYYHCLHTTGTSDRRILKDEQGLKLTGRAKKSLYNIFQTSSINKSKHMIYSSYIKFIVYAGK